MNMKKKTAVIMAGVIMASMVFVTGEYRLTWQIQ